MIYKATKLIEKAYLDADLKCTVRELEKVSYVEAGFTGKNCSFKLRFISSNDDNNVKAMSSDFAKYPADKIPGGFKTMNELSQTYKYYKFILDESDGGVRVQYDFPVSLPDEAVGKTAIELGLRCMNIVDDAFPKVMKSIWA